MEENFGKKNKINKEKNQREVIHLFIQAYKDNPALWKGISKEYSNKRGIGIREGSDSFATTRVRLRFDVQLV